MECQVHCYYILYKKGEYYLSGELLTNDYDVWMIVGSLFDHGTVNAFYEV